MMPPFYEDPRVWIVVIGGACALVCHYRIRRFLVASAAASIATTALIAIAMYLRGRYIDGWIFIALGVTLASAFAVACFVGLLVAIVRWGNSN